VALLGDLLERGDAAAARAAGDRQAIERLLVANGVTVDLESAVYRADHRIEPAATVALARKGGLRVRRSTATTRWALARAAAVTRRPPGRTVAAARDEGCLLYFHRGYAAGCSGDRVAMRAWYRSTGTDVLRPLGSVAQKALS
jgi:hypothetical protein